VEVGGVFFCCAHCAHTQDIHDLVDRPDSEKERIPA
jgi:hypothetical protein